MKRPLVLAMSMVLTACGSSGSGDGTADATTDSNIDTDADTDTDSETGLDPDPEPEPDPTTPDFEQICRERGFEGCYYVSNSGTYPPGTEGHHLSIADVSTHPFGPGDIILFARGDTWRYEYSDGSLITLTSSGDEDQDLVFGAYGEGPPPKFLGSIAADGWISVIDDVWESSTDIPVDPDEISYGAEVFFEAADGSALFGHHEDSIAGLDRAGDWTWADGRITVYAEGDPAAIYESVEVPQAQELIRLNDQQYLHFDSLTLKYMVRAGFADNYGNMPELRGLRVSNTEIGYVGVENSGSAYGLSLKRSEVHVVNSRIHDCGRRSISLVLYEVEASVIRDVLIEGNHFHGGYHTTGVDVQANTASSGSHTIEDIVIRNNLFEGDPNYDIEGEDGFASNHIFINQDEGAVLRGIYIYSNLFTYAQGSAIKTSGGEDIYIHHNTFYGFNPSYDNYQAQIFGGDRTRNTVIVNNVFYNDATDDRYACVEFGAGRAGEYTIDRNLYFASSYAHARLLWVDGGISYFFDDDWAGYQAMTGFDANSPTPASPEFVDAPVDLRPGPTSPAIGAGIAVDWISADYHGDPINRPPDLGAIQGE